MQVKLLRIEQPRPDILKVEEAINKEIKILESKNKSIKDVKISVVRDAAPEYKTSKSFACTILILYE